MRVFHVRLERKTLRVDSGPVIEIYDSRSGVHAESPDSERASIRTVLEKWLGENGDSLEIISIYENWVNGHKELVCWCQEKEDGK